MAYTTIPKSSDYFNTITWTGDSTTPKNIEGVGFQPDLIWGKIRSQAYSHQIYDTVRGFGNDKELTPNNTNAEGGTNAEVYGYLSAVTSDGFTAVKGTDATGYDYWNESPDTYVAWNWLANGAGSANTDGSISSTVSANTTSGFSIVSYTGTGANATVGHGLGSTPKMIIFKDRSNVNGWHTYHSSFANATDLLLLDTDGALYTANNYINNTRPTSSVFSLGNTAGTNGSSANYIAYCFADVQGFSKFGNYTANGSTDGTFIYTGFKPAFFLAKRITNGTEPWVMFDNKRANPFNGVTGILKPNLNEAETTQGAGPSMDFLSNGIKFRNTDGTFNNSGIEFIYMAFAEQPLVGDNPATAR